MSNLFVINRKIKSITTTSKITNALKLVSSNQANLYKEFQKKSLPYMQGIYRVFFELFNNPDHDIKTTNKKFISYSGNRQELCVVLGTDIGMCGDLNEKLKKYISDSFDKSCDGLIVLGQKISYVLNSEFKDYFELKMGSELEISNIEISVKKLSLKILNIFMSKHYKKLTMVYLKDPRAGIIEKLNILPFTENYFVNKKKVFVKSLHATVNYPEIILDLFPQYLECIVIGAFISSKLGEHTIRRELMYNATKNANELLDEYKLTFNKIRQANITREITEIVAAVQTRKK